MDCQLLILQATTQKTTSIRCRLLIVIALVTTHQASALSPLNQCWPNPCQNGGRCSLDYTNSSIRPSASCLCSPGWIGQQCERRALGCQSNPCRNGGRCEDEGRMRFKCHCSNEFVGPTCQLPNPCLNQPCLHRGICQSNPLGTYSCQCRKWYTGLRCEQEINPCIPTSPCIGPGSTCHVVRSSTQIGQGQDSDLVETFKCNCSRGFTGDQCQVKVGGCHEHDCRNGAECSPHLDGSFECQCRHGYYGARCEFHQSQQPTKRVRSGNLDQSGVSIKVNQPLNDDASQVKPDCANCSSVARPNDGLCQGRCKFLPDDCGLVGGEDDDCDPFWGQCLALDSRSVNDKLEATCVEKFNNGQCDPECNIGDCYSDGFDCAIKSANDSRLCADKAFCLAIYGDRKCHPNCTSPECGFDGGDCLTDSHLERRSIIATDWLNQSQDDVRLIKLRLVNAPASWALTPSRGGDLERRSWLAVLGQVLHALVEIGRTVEKEGAVEQGREINLIRHYGESLQGVELIVVIRQLHNECLELAPDSECQFNLLFHLPSTQFARYLGAALTTPQSGNKFKIDLIQPIESTDQIEAFVAALTGRRGWSELLQSNQAIAAYIGLLLLTAIIIVLVIYFAIHSPSKPSTSSGSSSTVGKRKSFLSSFKSRPSITSRHRRRDKKIHSRATWWPPTLLHVKMGQEDGYYSRQFDPSICVVGDGHQPTVDHPADWKSSTPIDWYLGGSQLDSSNDRLLYNEPIDRNMAVNNESKLDDSCPRLDQYLGSGGEGTQHSFAQQQYIQQLQQHRDNLTGRHPTTTSYVPVRLVDAPIDRTIGLENRQPLQPGTTMPFNDMQFGAGSSPCNPAGSCSTNQQLMEEVQLNRLIKQGPCYHQLHPHQQQRRLNDTGFTDCKLEDISCCPLAKSPQNSDDQLFLLNRQAELDRQSEWARTKLLLRQLDGLHPIHSPNLLADILGSEEVKHTDNYAEEIGSYTPNEYKAGSLSPFTLPPQHTDRVKIEGKHANYGTEKTPDDYFTVDNPMHLAARMNAGEEFTLRASQLLLLQSSHVPDDSEQQHHGRPKVDYDKLALLRPSDEDGRTALCQAAAADALDTVAALCRLEREVSSQTKLLPELDPLVNGPMLSLQQQPPPDPTLTTTRSRGRSRLPSHAMRCHVSPLIAALQAGNERLFEQLLDEGFTSRLSLIDSLGRNVVHWAAVTNSVAALRRLERCKGFRKLLNARDDLDRTPLLLACREGASESVALLLANKASVTIRDCQEMTALEVAHERGYTDIVQLLATHVSGETGHNQGQGQQHQPIRTANQVYDGEEDERESNDESMEEADYDNSSD